MTPVTRRDAKAVNFGVKFMEFPTLDCLITWGSVEKRSQGLHWDLLRTPGIKKLYGEKWCGKRVTKSYVETLFESVGRFQISILATSMFELCGADSYQLTDQDRQQLSWKCYDPLGPSAKSRIIQDRSFKSTMKSFCKYQVMNWQHGDQRTRQRDHGIHIELAVPLEADENERQDMVWSQIKLSLFKTKPGQETFQFPTAYVSNTCNAFRIVILLKKGNAYKRRFLKHSFRNPSDGIIKHYLGNQQDHRCGFGLSDREDTIVIVLARRCKSGAIGLFLLILVQPVAKSLEKRCTLACRKCIVDVYRRSEFLPDVARDFIERMRKFSGHNWDWKIKKQKKFFEQVEKAYRHEPCIKREHPTDLRRLLYGL